MAGRERGLFIFFEGPDGGGKSTQAQILTERLDAQGRRVLLTREPGGTAIGEQVRGVVMNFANEGMRPMTELFLIQAARRQHVEEKIKPCLEQGGVVVCDRYMDSSTAYQGYGHGLDLDTTRAIIGAAIGGVVPDLTLLFDLDVEVGRKRREEARGEWNRLDAMSLEFHRRARKGFLFIARDEPERMVVVDATQSPEKIAWSIWQLVSVFLRRREDN